MTALSGALVLIRLGDGSMPENFTTIGGLRMASLRLNNQLLVNNTLLSTQWRQALPSAGISSVTITGTGMFTDAAIEQSLLGCAFRNTANNYQFAFANGDVMTGAFQVTDYERSGDLDGEENYALTLQSAGDITYTPAG